MMNRPNEHGKLQNPQFWYFQDYLGKGNNITIDESQQVKIFVNPNGNLKGPVSIGLVAIK